MLDTGSKGTRPFGKLAGAVSGIDAKKANFEWRDAAAHAKLEPSAAGRACRSPLSVGSDYRAARPLRHSREKHTGRWCEAEGCPVVLGKMVGMEPITVTGFEKRKPAFKLPSKRNTRVVHVFK